MVPEQDRDNSSHTTILDIMKMVAIIIVVMNPIIIIIPFVLFLLLLQGL